MEEFGSSEGLRHNNNQTPSGSLDAPRKATLNTYRNDQGSSRTSGSFQSHESKISAETTDAGDQAGARQAGTEQNVSSSISDSRQPAYPSYAAYLREIKETRPQYEDLWGCLDWKYDGRYPGAFRILIADSGKDGIRGNIWASARNSMRGLPVDETLRDRVIGQITTPPKGDVHVRIIVLELELGQQASSRDIVDAIGRTYDINPAFLNAFFCYNRNRLDVSPRRSARSPLPQRKSFLRFHGFFVGQVMDRQRSSGVAMKIVLVLSWLSGISFQDPYVHGIALDGPPTIYSTANVPSSRRSIFSPGEEGRNIGSHCQVYASWLSQLDQHQRAFNNLHPYEFICPWIEYRIYDIKADICRLRLKLDSTRAQISKFGELGDPERKFNDGSLFSHANNVRDSLADALELRSTLAKLSGLDNTRKVQDIREVIKDIVEDADRGLRIISEIQQTAIGTMAIQESRRSIKEAVSAKRLTQLTFVFIPLSYAASLFGMNINEITGSGLKLWVFLVTSLALLIDAILSTLFAPAY